MKEQFTKGNIFDFDEFVPRVPQSGVYAIRNKKTGKKYIGQSKNIARRFEEHARQLVSNKHTNKSLQDDFDKFGGHNFEFLVIELCEEPQLLQSEEFFILSSFQEELPLYNIQGVPYVLP